MIFGMDMHGHGEREGGATTGLSSGRHRIASARRPRRRRRRRWRGHSLRRRWCADLHVRRSAGECGHRAVHRHRRRRATDLVDGQAFTVRVEAARPARPCSTAASATRTCPRRQPRPRPHRVVHRHRRQRPGRRAAPRRSRRRGRARRPRRRRCGHQDVARPGHDPLWQCDVTLVLPPLARHHPARRRRPSSTSRRCSPTGRRPDRRLRRQGARPLRVVGARPPHRAVGVVDRRRLHRPRRSRPPPRSRTTAAPSPSSTTGPSTSRTAPSPPAPPGFGVGPVRRSPPRSRSTRAVHRRRRLLPVGVVGPRRPPLAAHRRREDDRGRGAALLSGHLGLDEDLQASLIARNPQLAVQTGAIGFTDAERAGRSAGHHLPRLELLAREQAPEAWTYPNSKRRSSATRRARRSAPSPTTTR